MTSENDATRAAGAVTNPGATERLHQYWVHGDGLGRRENPLGFTRLTRRLRPVRDAPRQVRQGPAGLLRAGAS
jgi:hypothetical protein